MSHDDVRRGFGSDNHSGVHPRIMDAMIRVNDGHMPAYDTDPLSRQAHALMKDLFGRHAETHFVFNGTAANVLALSTIVRSHHSILASQHAHIVVDECGAPEKHLGCKLIAVPSVDAKLTPDMLKPYLVRRGDQHVSQVRAISITQPTELGTLYSRDEIKALAEFARREGLFLHVDGARLVNAAAALDVTLKELTADLGVDVLSLGGTKNGLLFGEAVIFLKPGLSEDFKFVRKQFMQLASKTRFIAAQFLEFLGTDLWKTNARHANRMARILSDALSEIPELKVTQKTQANSVFVTIPKPFISRLRDEAFFYVWDEATFECRLMTSWDTSETDIERFLALLKELLLSA